MKLNKLGKFIAIALALPFVLCGVKATAQNEDKESGREKFVVDEVVAVVGSSAIFLSDLQLAEEYLRLNYLQQGYSSNNVQGEAFESLLMQKLLATQAAIDSLTINEAGLQVGVEQRLNDLIASKGSQQALEDFYKKPIFSIKDILLKRLREGEMAKTMQNTVESVVTISPTEVNLFYQRASADSLPVVPEQYKYAKIAKLPSKSDERKMDVKEQLLSIRSRIMNGASFGALARLYSDDPGSAQRGGEMEPQPSSMFVKEFRDAVESLKVGKLSEVIETEYGYHILEVMEKQGDNYKVRHILMKVKFNAEDKERALVLLDSVSNEIKLGEMTFEEGVAKYSDDEPSKISDGVVTNNLYQNYGAKYKSTKFTKEELDRLYYQVQDMKEGDVSPAFVTTNMSGDESVEVIKLLKIYPTHTANLNDDYTAVEEMALADKKNKTFEEWLVEKIDEIYIHIDDKYKDIKTEHNWHK